MIVRAKEVRDGGFTLIELLIAVVVLGIIIVPLTGAFMAGLATTRDTEARLAETVSAVFTSSFWAADVQSANGTIVKNGSACDNSVPALVTFNWVDLVSATQTPTRSASYVAEPVTVYGEPMTRLVRISCSSMGTSRVTVAPRLREAPTVTCLTRGTETNCSLPANPLLQPDQVVIDMRTSGSRYRGVTRPFKFSVTGTRRSTT